MRKRENDGSSSDNQRRKKRDSYLVMNPCCPVNRFIASINVLESPQVVNAVVNKGMSFAICAWSTPSGSKFCKDPSASVRGNTLLSAAATAIPIMREAKTLRDKYLHLAIVARKKKRRKKEKLSFLLLFFSLFFTYCSAHTLSGSLRSKHHTQGGGLARLCLTTSLTLPLLLFLFSFFSFLVCASLSLSTSSR